MPPLNDGTSSRFNLEKGGRYLKGTYYENNTFPGIWGVVLGSLGLPHAYKL
jgi:hypothetical protein